MYRRQEPPTCRLPEQATQQRDQSRANQSDTATGHQLFYHQLGVKPAQRRAAACQEIYGVFKNRPGAGRSSRDLLHLRDGFEIEMDFDRNVSCLFAVDVFMDNDFFHQAV